MRLNRATAPRPLPILRERCWRPLFWKNTGSESAQVIQGAATENGLAETSSAPTYTTVNTAADFTVTIHGQLADPSDELSIEAFVIEAVFMP